MLEALARANFERDVAAIDRRVAAMRGWTIVEEAFPFLDIVFPDPVKPIRLKFECCDWEEVPPLIRLLEPDGEPIKNMPIDPRSIFNHGPNPATGLPFICMRGSREYHQLHAEDRWDNHRSRPGLDLGSIAAQLARVWSGIAK